MTGSPKLTVDAVILGIAPENMSVLLVQRDRPPFAGQWALPGGFVDVGEDLVDAARRELQEETGLRGVPLEQVGAFGRPGRDPRGHVVSVVFHGVAWIDSHRVAAASDARSVGWFALDELPPLAFDHEEIVAVACDRTREKAERRPVPVSAVPKRFTLTQLQHAAELLAGRRLDKRNFRRQMLATGLLVPLEETQRNVAHRAARLYRFDRRRHARTVDDGI